jgi:hypothetical protein
MCHYGARLSHPRLVAARLTRRPSVIRGLVGLLNSLPSPPRVACPRGDGSEVILLVGYARRAPMTVTVGLTGCELVRRGRVVRSAARDDRGRQLIAELVGEP